MLWESNGGNIMFQLLCDKCGKRIEYDEKVIEITLEEKCSDGYTGFIIKPSHLQNSAIVCKDCAHQVYELLNFYIAKVDF